MCANLAVYISAAICAITHLAAECARMGRYVGIEPTFAAWEAVVLPLHQYRVWPDPPWRRIGQRRKNEHCAGWQRRWGRGWDLNPRRAGYEPALEPLQSSRRVRGCAVSFHQPPPTSAPIAELSEVLSFSRFNTRLPCGGMWRTRTSAGFPGLRLAIGPLTSRATLQIVLPGRRLFPHRGDSAVCFRISGRDSLISRFIYRGARCLLHRRTRQTHGGAGRRTRTLTPFDHGFLDRCSTS